MRPEPTFEECHVTETRAVPLDPCTVLARRFHGGDDRRGVVLGEVGGAEANVRAAVDDEPRLRRHIGGEFPLQEDGREHEVVGIMPTDREIGRVAGDPELALRGSEAPGQLEAEGLRETDQSRQRRDPVGFRLKIDRLSTALKATITGGPVGLGSQPRVGENLR